MTISPPAKVKPNRSSTQILASGIDSLYLAIDVHWSNTDFFDYLANLKETAKNTRKDAPGFFELDKGKYKYPFNVKPNGKNGHEWIITNKEFDISFGAWKRPQSKPSVLVKISSEALWHLGAENTVDKIIQILFSQGGTGITIKPSRVDLCVDALFSEHTFNPKLVDFSTTRSTYICLHFNHKKLTGVGIGKGKISARLYDKPLEIRQKSKKLWMYDIWRINEVPKGWKVIRTEFQLRREALKQLAINDAGDLFLHCDRIWAYCSQKWLKFQTNPGKHHTQRKTLTWWETIQNGFLGVQDPAPLIRSKALRHDIKQSTTQAIGYVRAIIAARIAAQELDEYVPAEIEDGLEILLKEINQTEESKAAFAESVRGKKVKFHRTLSQHNKAETERKKLGFPTEN